MSIIVEAITVVFMNATADRHIQGGLDLAKFCIAFPHCQIGLVTSAYENVSITNRGG